MLSTLHMACMPDRSDLSICKHVRAISKEISDVETALLLDPGGHRPQKMRMRQGLPYLLFA